MNQELQKNEQPNVRMTEVHFEAWPATGLIPNRFCFLHTYFSQRREDAKKTADPLDRLDFRMFRAN